MYNQTPSTRREMIPPTPYDRTLIVIVLGLTALGLLMVASASIVISDHHLHQPFYFFYKQLIFLLIGSLLGSIIVQFDLSIWEKLGNKLLIATIVCLILVLIPGIGHSVNGSSRWLGLGIIGLQVSEMAKLIVVIYLARYLVRHQSEIKNTVSGFLKPMAVLSIIAILLLREPDFGATAVIMATALGMMFLAGMRLRVFLCLLLLIAAALSVIAISEPYRMQRLTGFLNPWANPFSSGYQLTQSLIAFGRGGWLGVGLGNSIQKLFYLPEAHTDFLFAVIAEEFGFVGMLGIIVLFTIFVLRILFIGREAQKRDRHFSGYLAYGIGLWIAIQFIINIGVNSGILPTKGLTLPLMSYGGSSLLIICIAVALLLRIDYENRMLMLGIRE